MKDLFLSCPVAHPLDKEDRNPADWKGNGRNHLVPDQLVDGNTFIDTFEVCDELNLVRRSDAPRSAEVPDDRLVPILAGVFAVFTLRPVLGDYFHECELFGVSTCQFGRARVENEHSRVGDVFNEHFVFSGHLIDVGIGVECTDSETNAVGERFALE